MLTGMTEKFLVFEFVRNISLENGFKKCLCKKKSTYSYLNRKAVEEK